MMLIKQEPNLNHRFGPSQSQAHLKTTLDSIQRHPSINQFDFKHLATSSSQANLPFSAKKLANQQKV
jgi:hypothetical protein